MNETRKEARMNGLIRGLAALPPLVLAVAALAGEPEKYLLHYKFRPGETVRWEVEHRSNVRTTVAGTTQSAETLSLSVKAWRFTAVRADGAATFEHRVERVDMRQKLTGRDEIRYNSQTDCKPPLGFEDAARSVGVPLSIVTMSAEGKVLSRDRRQKKPQPLLPSATPTDTWMTIPLPVEAVAVGHTWSFPQDIDIPQPGGGSRRIKAVQQFTLESVKTGVAMIRIATQILTPVSDPAIESQLVEREAAGWVRFDIDAGRVLAEQLDIDKHVVGFRGDASSIHYVNRFSERLVSEPAQTAAKAADGRQ
jgi:hypothetical protein